MLKAPPRLRRVDTLMTPEAPREPYWAVSDASFRIVKLSMSPGYREPRVERSLITPSMMTSGSLPPVREVVPLTRTALSIAAWLAPETVTPALWPDSAPRPLVTRPLFICSRDTVCSPVVDMAVVSVWAFRQTGTSSRSSRIRVLMGVLWLAVSKIIIS